MTDDCDGMKAGTRVCLVHDPLRIGVVTGRQRERAGGTLLQVQFPNGPHWIPASQLKEISDQLSPLEMLERKQLGQPIHLRRTLTHAKLSGRLHDVIYSMEITNTDFYAFQFKPVLKILDSPSQRILVADEVGLGKTIEAGLIWTELRSRFDMRRLLVLCPAALREKWQGELATKFGINAAICDAGDALDILSNRSYHDRGFAIIGSIQGLRPPRNWKSDETKRPSARLARHLESAEHQPSLVDLLVIDEAHHLRNPNTQNYGLGRLARNVAEYAVFLTATPIHNRNEDLHSLLRLLDPATFETPSAFDLILDANRPLVRARDLLLRANPAEEELRSLIEEAERHPLLRNNRQLAMMLREIRRHGVRRADIRSSLAYRIETVNPLAHVITRTRKRDVTTNRVVREPRLETVSLHRAEQRFYNIVTHQVINYALERAANERFLLAQPQRQMTSSMAASLASWRDRRVELAESDETGEERDEAIRGRLGPLVRRIVEASTTVDPQELRDVDTKYSRLRHLVRGFLRRHAGEKLVIFSAFRPTLHYLAERLAEDGIDSALLMGGQAEPKSDVIARFRGPNGPRVLLSSEVGGEGVDLQFCWVVINYDLPWNPMRIEQRIGRLDRIGQMSSKVQIINILYGDTIDARIYERLYDKLDLCRNALGDFEAILGDEIRKLEHDLISQVLSPEQQNDRIEQTALALENTRTIEAALEEDAAGLIAHGDYILNHVRDVRALHRWIDGVDLLGYVSDHVRQHYRGSDWQQVGEDPTVFDVRLSPDAKVDLQHYIRSTNRTYTGRLASPSGQAVRVRFKNRVADGTRGNSEELISQFHPLVQMVRSKNDATGRISPAVSLRIDAREADPPVPPGLYMLSVSRWSFEGLRRTESLSYNARCMDEDASEISPEDAERLAAAALGSSQDWIEAHNVVDLERARRVAADLFDEAYGRYEREKDEMSARNEDRADIQQRNLESHSRRREQRLQEILGDHMNAGRTGLAEATRAKIREMKDSVQQQHQRIDRGRKLSSEYEEVAVAVINIDRKRNH